MLTSVVKKSITSKLSGRNEGRSWWKDIYAVRRNPKVIFRKIN